MDENMRTMAELSILGWTGFILLPIACETLILRFIFRYPLRWLIGTLAIANVLNWLLCFVVYPGLHFFAHKLYGLLYLTYGLLLKFIIILPLLLYQVDRKKKPLKEVVRCILGTGVSIFIGWMVMAQFIYILALTNLIWR